MTRALSFLAAVAAVLVLAPVAGAQELTPVGRWTTTDDNTGKDRSIVVVTERDGKLYGHIEKLILDAGEDPAPKCDKCPDEKKDQPVIGLEILWGLKKDGDEWSGGKILDPENGKSYKCWIQVIDDGRRLKVRGYVGISLLGRTQYWKKAKD